MISAGILTVLALHLFFANCPSVPAQDLPPNQTVEVFFNAIQKNDTNSVFNLLATDTNLARATYYGRLPLHVAASKGCAEIVRELLRKGADIDAAGDTLDTMNSRLTALEAAIWYGHSHVCWLLLEAGADPDVQSLFEGSALHYAFTYHRPEMAGWLLDYGADPFLEKKNPYNQTTPLEAAIIQGAGKLVPRMLGQDRRNPLGAKTRGKSSRTKSVADLRQAAAKVLAERGVVLLEAAAQRGELEAVQALIEAGVSAKGTNDRGEPLLRAFALATTEAAKTRPAALAQLQRTRGMLDDLTAGANPQFQASIRAQEAQQAATVEASDPARRQQILALLIKQGADYDVFAVTALGGS